MPHINVVAYKSIAKEVLNLDITLMSPEGIRGILSVNSLGRLVMKKDDLKDQILCDEKVISFDGICKEDETTYIFFSSDEGNLYKLELREDKSILKPLMMSKDNKSKIFGLKVLLINGAFHLFYCFESTHKYLTHQIVLEDIVYEPKAIGIIGDSTLYDIVADDDFNIHIVYISTESDLKYTQYINSQKVHTKPKTVLSGDIRKICITSGGQRIFGAYVQNSRGVCSINLVSILDSKVRKTSIPAYKETEISLNSKGDTLILNTVDKGVCYEAISDFDFNISKATPIGRSSKIGAVRSIGFDIPVRYYPISLKNEPLKDYVNFAKTLSLKDALLKPKGSEAEEFYQKYKDVFEKKAEELKNEDFSQSLARIEASLKKLVETVESALKIMTNYESKEYNIEKGQKEEQY